MTRNRFNQAKNHRGNGNNLTLSKARGLFLEDNDSIDMKDTYKITNAHPPIDEKDVVNKEYCDNNLLSSSNKIDILSKNITELRKGDFDKVTTKTLQLNETQVNEELINDRISLISYYVAVNASNVWYFTFNDHLKHHKINNLRSLPINNKISKIANFAPNKC